MGSVNRFLLPASLAVMGILMMSAPIQAGEPQWLSYCWAPQPPGATRPIAPELSSSAPDGIALPTFIHEQPLFGVWESPLAPDGKLHFVFDSSMKSGPMNRLYIDTNADGSLADETPSDAYRTEGSGSYSRSMFGPIAISLPGEDGPVTYHLNAQFLKYDQDNFRCYIQTGGWYQGEVDLGGQTRKILLTDNNTNGTFNDTGDSFFACDHIRFDPTSGQTETHTVGKYLEFSGEIYRLQVAQDGSSFTLEPAGEVASGTVAMPDGMDRIRLIGENGMFSIPYGDNKPNQIPIGQYKVYDWRTYRNDQNGQRWHAIGHGEPGRCIVTIVSDQQADLPFGFPLQGKVEVHQRGSKQYSFSTAVTGKAGERVDVSYASNARPPAPKLLIRNEDGSYEKTYQFEYG